MIYNPDIHHRRSIRIKDHDYTQPGAYFVTICTQNRECLFGQIVNGKMQLNDAGLMVQSNWKNLPTFYHGVDHVVIGQAQSPAPTNTHGRAKCGIAGPSLG